MTLGLRLRKLRKDMELSQAKLAALIAAAKAMAFPIK